MLIFYFLFVISVSKVRVGWKKIPAKKNNGWNFLFGKKIIVALRRKSNLMIQPKQNAVVLSCDPKKRKKS